MTCEYLVHDKNNFRLRIKIALAEFNYNLLSQQS